MRLLREGAARDLAVEGERALIAVGWATVDLERAASEVPDVRFADPGEEPALGGRTLRTRVESTDLVLMEPSIDRRLAGWLARNGEGVAVLYLEGATTAESAGQPTALGRLGRLVVPEDRTRPFQIVVDPI